jgi:bla regulator protein BlaR1
MKRILFLFIAAAFVAPSMHAQAKLPAFAVSTVKPSKSAGGPTRFFFMPYGLSIENISLQTIILQAYTLQDDQLVGTPAWAKDTRYDIEAKVDDEEREALKNLPQAERGNMVHALLADRFHLKTHNETRDLRVFALLVAKSGLKMTPTPPAADPRAGNHGIYFANPGEVHATDCSLELVASVLSSTTHHLVIDRTGLTAHYNFILRFTDDNTPADASNSAPSLYTALQEQLGLRLDSTKAPMPVLVIDSIAQPTPD